MVRFLSNAKLLIQSEKLQKLFYSHPKADIKPNVFYHGSPYDFDAFDISKIGTGEGASKRGAGLYLFRTKKYAPFFANIKSKDAPPHIGWGGKPENPAPAVYTVGAKSKLNLKQVTEQDAKKIARNQDEFEKMHPEYDGIELPSTEICIFPKAIDKLEILKKQQLLDFVSENASYPFRTWTTDKNILETLV